MAFPKATARVGARLVVWLLVAAATVVGLYARTDGLGSRPLSNDEYYFARSVERIVETGSVRFSTGGYYVRGLLPQYLTAASWSLFGRNGPGLRLPILIFSLASILTAFFYARLWVGPLLAGLVAAALLVSSWHVEMGRFLRMYAPFQLATLLFLIAAHRSYTRGDSRLCYLPHFALTTAALCHELAVFLSPLLFLPLVPPVRDEALLDRRTSLRFAAVSAALTLALVAWNRGAFYHQGVTDQYPEGYAPRFADLIRLPAKPLWSLGAGDAIDLVVLAVLMASVVAVFAAFGVLRSSSGRRLCLLSLLLVAAVLHQMAIVALLALLLLGRYGLAWARKPSRATKALVVTSLATVAGWSLIMILTRPWGQEVGAVTAVHRLFFGLPDLAGTLAIWWRYLPILASTLALAVVIVLVKRRRAPLTGILSHPATLVVYVVLCLGTVQPRIPSLRYSFFIYPLLLTVLAIAVSDLSRQWMRRRHVRDARISVVATMAFSALFLAGEDFNRAHLANVPGDEATFCVADFQRLRSPQGPWFCRDDVYSPAAWLNDQLSRSPREPVIVASQPTASYYLQPDHAHYLRRTSVLFDAHSREKGTVDIWSGRPLVSTPAGAQAYVAGARTAWLVRAVNERRAFPERFLFPDRLSASESVFKGVDGRIEVVRLQLEP